ncbi:hypothetical protein V8B97DRAFT_2027098 [Scleroderma yunnanense]
MNGGKLREFCLYTQVGDGKFSPFDAQVLAFYDNYVITSPNSNYVPKPHIFHDDIIEPLCNRRFGVLDCFQWLQLHAEQYIWSRCIPWQVLQQLDAVYKCLDECAQKWLKENPKYNSPIRLEAWVLSCHQALMHLKQLLCTFCDTVLTATLFQCLCLDVFSMLNYLETPVPLASSNFHHAFDHWMGMFTTDHEVCQCLFKSSTVNVYKKVEITCPTGIITDPEEFNVGQVLKWDSKWYHGRESWHWQTQHTLVIGIETSSCSGAGTLRTQRVNCHQHPCKFRGDRQPVVINMNADLWNDPNDKSVPSFIYSWHVALQNLDKDPRRVHPDAPKMAYYFPHPTLFMRETADVFESAFIRTSQDTESEVLFWDLSLNVASLGKIDNFTKGKILWDLYKHNFQFELLALDRLLVPQIWSNPNNTHLNQVCQVFPGDAEFTMCMESFLMKNQGIASQDLQEKHHYTENFRVLLSSWPGFLTELETSLLPSAVVACVWVVEKKLALFYTQHFFDNFGQPPIVPHLIPNPPPLFYIPQTPA